tara:strand:+ start:310 stop:750 length:441 start_codon:yes stop_codon:yes gene_type:complete
MPTIHPDYGDVHVTRITDVDHVLALLDELGEELKVICQDNSHEPCYYYQRGRILEAWKDGRLYGLCVQETAEMAQRHASDDLIFVRTALGWPFHRDWIVDSHYRLPCFCMLGGDGSPEMTWCAMRAQVYDLGGYFVFDAVDTVDLS